MRLDSSAAKPTCSPGGRQARHQSLPEILSWCTLIALGVWAAAPVLYLLLKAGADHETFSGANGIFAGDQLQYMAWIRSSGEHGLAADDFALRTGSHVFLHPMFFFSGLLWRAGLGIAASYLVWLPVAVGVLFFGFRKYTDRLLDLGLGRAAALIVALFFVAPADVLTRWTGGSNGLALLGGELTPAGLLWGYLPGVIAVGLMPLFVLGIDQIVEPGQRRGQRSQAWYATSCAATGMAVAWLHPWQGATLLVLTTALLVLNRLHRRVWPLLVPAAGTAIPLGYYLVLSHSDQGWLIAQAQTPLTRPSLLLLALAVAPLLCLAVPAMGRRPVSTREQLLLLWPLSSLVVYLLATSYPPHALEGLSLPLTVLTMRGCQRIGVTARLAIPALVLATLPGLALDAHVFRGAAGTNEQPLLIRADETRALDFLARMRSSGGVLASLHIAPAVPAYTGRRTWVGHPIWTPGYIGRAKVTSDFFTGRMSPLRARAFVRQAGARYILADCERRFPSSRLGRLVVSERAFGCVTIYRLAVPALTGEF